MSSGSIQLVVTDLDGTLWDRECTIHPEPVLALDQLRAEGIPVLAATARRQRSVLRRLDRYGLSLPLVLLDGAWDETRHATPPFSAAPSMPPRYLA